MMMRWAQISAGMGEPILKETRELVHLEGRWIAHLITEMQKIRCKIKIINGWIPEPHRERDRYLMDAVTDSKLISPQHKKIINYCRLYMKMTFISEMSTPDGK